MDNINETADRSIVEVNKKGFWAAIQGYFEKNLMIALWSIFLFIGGLMFILHFAQIGFMPELDIKSSLSLLVASAFSAAITFLLCCLALILPGLTWSFCATKRRLSRSMAC